MVIHTNRTVFLGNSPRVVYEIPEWDIKRKVAKFARLTFKHSKWKKSRLISSKDNNVIKRFFLPHTGLAERVFE